ncbi:hypothetical protein ACRAWD_26515 [Caulobacter segnis]
MALCGCSADASLALGAGRFDPEKSTADGRSRRRAQRGKPNAPLGLGADRRRNEPGVAAAQRRAAGRLAVSRSCRAISRPGLAGRASGRRRRRSCTASKNSETFSVIPAEAMASWRSAAGPDRGGVRPSGPAGDVAEAVIVAGDVLEVGHGVTKGVACRRVTPSS